jgi:hypothetical protein
MSASIRRVVRSACTVIFAGLFVMSLPLAAHGTGPVGSTFVVRASTPGCGYDGRINGQPTYNHCGAGSVVIEVDHVFWQHTYACMPRGVHVIPQGDSSWAIIGAEYDEHRCSYTQPISVVGP